MPSRATPPGGEPTTMLVLVATGSQAADRLRSLADQLAVTAHEQDGPESAGLTEPESGPISARLFAHVDDALLDRLAIRPAGARLPARPAPAPGPQPARPGSRITLTEREAQILALLASGQSNRLIGRWLFLSESTVKAHLTRLYVKFAVNNRTAAVVAARRLGLLPD